MKSGKATIGFAAHLANWELPGVGAKLIGVQIRRALSGGRISTPSATSSSSCASR